MRYAGATGQLTVRADSGFYNHAIVAACRKLSVRFSITVRQHASLCQDVFIHHNPQFPTVPVRLVRTDETMRNALGLNRPPTSNPV